MLEIGSKVFGEWSIDEKIGSGAFGTVYKIKRVEFGNEYYAALKVINIPQDSEEQARLRSEGMDDESITTYYGQIAQDFIQEIKLLSSLDGITNIVDYKDHSVVPNDNMGYTIYIKMQLLTPLNKMLVNEENKAVFLAENQIIDLGIDICSALEICEKHKIIHRDIKVDNIFVSANGDYKLGDFGIAKQLEATQGEMSKKGTMMYMAPEVFKGENYNHTVDIYSLGIVMYRLFNKNRAPFFPQYPNPIKFSDKETANAQRLNGAELPDIPGLSEKLMAVLRKACAFRAEDRYKTAAEFKKCLKEIKKSGAVLNQSSETVEQVLHQEETINIADEKTETVFSTFVEPRNDVRSEVVFEEETEKTESVFGDFSSFNSVPEVETPVVEETEEVVAELVGEDEFEKTASAFVAIPAVTTTVANKTEPEQIQEDELEKTASVFDAVPSFDTTVTSETKTETVNKNEVNKTSIATQNVSSLAKETKTELAHAVEAEKKTTKTKKLSKKAKALMIINIILCIVSGAYCGYRFYCWGGMEFIYSVSTVISMPVFGINLISLLTILIRYKSKILMIINIILCIVSGAIFLYRFGLFGFSIYDMLYYGWLPDIGSIVVFGINFISLFIILIRNKLISILKNR